MHAHETWHYLDTVTALPRPVSNDNYLGLNSDTTEFCKKMFLSYNKTSVDKSGTTT
jgi:hypothetical protein